MQYQLYMKKYLRCVKGVDDNVGRILDYLDASGLAKNTVVMYTGDQGFFLGEHGLYDKRFMYEEALRMPFLVRWPGQVKPGSIMEGMILNVDFAPTILEAAGGRAHPDMQGRSFVSLLKGQIPADWRRSMYYRYYYSHFETEPQQRDHPEAGAESPIWRSHASRIDAAQRRPDLDCGGLDRSGNSR